jgi:N-acetylneuraminate synthase/N,N'-diacetyllegionaminate synthase
MPNSIKIGDRIIGKDTPVFIIAEAGVNHNGDFKIAKQLIDVAATAGADAVKFQTFTPELLVTETAPQAEYQKKNTGKVESQFDMLKRLELPRASYPELQTYAHSKGILFLSTPFSEDDADFLETINILAYKIPSGEITNIPYLKHIAIKGKPMIVSTGMADLREVKDAVDAIKNAGNDEIAILHSTSNYPPSPESLNLKAIETLAKEFPACPIGYSDNGTPGFIADVVAVGLGERIVEKHFTLDKNMAGPDHKASLDPAELKTMVSAIRATEKMLGDGVKRPAPEELPIAAVARKSIVLARDVPVGKIITREDLTTRRPGTGVSPSLLESIIGKKAARELTKGTVLQSTDYAT